MKRRISFPRPIAVAIWWPFSWWRLYVCAEWQLNFSRLLIRECVVWNEREEWRTIVYVKGVFHRNQKKTPSTCACLENRLLKKEGFEERGMFIHRMFLPARSVPSSACKDKTASGRFICRATVPPKSYYLWKSLLDDLIFPKRNQLLAALISSFLCQFMNVFDVFTTTPNFFKGTLKRG